MCAGTADGFQGPSLNAQLAAAQRAQARKDLESLQTEEDASLLDDVSLGAACVSASILLCVACCRRIARQVPDGADSGNVSMQCIYLASVRSERAAC